MSIINTLLKLGEKKTGAGISSMAKKSGSTLDGILGKSSGLKLPEPEIKLSNFADKSGREYASIGHLMETEELTPSEMRSLGIISSKNAKKLDDSVREIDSIKREAFEGSNALGVAGKSNLPKLNRNDYYETTLGKVGENNVRYKDVPDYMKNHLANDVNRTNDDILREFFGDRAENMSLSEMLNEYENLAQSAGKNNIYTSDNIDEALAYAGKDGKIIEADISDRIYGNKRDIDVAGGAGRAKNIKVKRQEPEVELGEVMDVEPASVKMTEKTDTNVVNGKQAVDTTGTEGFNVKLKNGEDIDIKLRQTMTPEEINRNNAIRTISDKWLKGLNATPTAYKEAMKKSKSAHKGYKTPAEMAKRNGVSLNNIDETPQAVIDSIEEAKHNIQKYAEERGVNVNLSQLNLTNIEPATKATMKMQGIDPDRIKYTGVASPTEAETLYKDLRNRAQKTTDGDRAAAYNVMADYVRKQLDETMDNLNLDFSFELSNALGKALGNNADPKYIRDIANNKKLKFSDLRREQSDWMKIGDLSGRPMKEEQNLSIAGVELPFRNPITAAIDKMEDARLNKIAYGQDNNINVISDSANGATGTLGGLLSKAKDAGAVGAGVLGGMALGGGGGEQGSGAGELAALNPMRNAEQESIKIDPRQSLTIGGYTYDELEEGYTNALMAGDTDAAKLIANMIGMLDDKVKRYEDSEKSSGNGTGIAAKQRAAMNVLSGLMQNFEAQGPLGGRFTGLMNMLTGGGYNPAVSAYDSGSKGSMGTIIKALGDTGALSEGDQKRALELLPKTTDTAESAKYKYQQLLNILEGAGAQ